MNPIITPFAGLAGLVIAFLILATILKRSGGEGKVKSIADKIHKGAMVFMRREFLLISFFAIIIGGLLFFFQKPEYGKQQSLAFFLGCLASSLAGFIGMYTATRANVRTTLAARDNGQADALGVAFFGGSVMGLTVASMGLIGLGGLYFFYKDNHAVAEIMEGFAMGASLVALFYRVGGGIFTKAADVGADLVGKVEAGIPEDDPRNPGVIADNVGDNVGDVAGMGSDIFESYCGAQIACVAIVAAMAAKLNVSDPSALVAHGASKETLMHMPLALTTMGLACSILGILLVKIMSAKDPASALRIGTIGAAVIFIAGAFGLCNIFGVSSNIAAAVLCGAVGDTTAAIGKGFAIGAAGLAALALITAFIQKAHIANFDFKDEAVLRTFFVGLFIGGVVPFLNGAITMDAVGKAAFEMINEIRRQFREIPGLLEGNGEPDSDKCVDIATRAATKRMILPAVLAVGTPIAVGFGFKTMGVGAIALTGTLCGALLGCLLMALFMSNAGGAWDNAKKYVEEGHHGGKNSETHKGCVVGDTVGDPFKDTSGPSMNILINVMAIVSLVIAPLL